MSDEAVKTQRFFTRDEIILCVRGPQRFDISQFMRWLNMATAGLEPRFELLPRRNNAHDKIRASFKIGDNYTSMLVIKLIWPSEKKVDDEEHDTAIRQYITKLNTLDDPVIPITPNPIGFPPDQPVGDVMPVSTHLSTDTRESLVGIGADDAPPLAYSDISAEPLTFVAASPNWLFVGAQVQLVGGGPGGAPVEVPVPKPEEYELHFPELDPHLPDGDQSNTPVVVIFDTVPPKDLWDGIVENSRLTSDQNKSLLDKLASELTIIHADNSNDWPIPDDRDLGYAHEPDYDMSNHGLFSAGLIYSAAPCARIYLVQVLNKYGVGSNDGLQQAFEALANGNILKGDDNTRPLIVNLSLTISFLGTLEAKPDETGIKGSFSTVAANFLRTLLVAPLKQSLEGIKPHVSKREIVIYAAAGNDDGRYGARFPAAFAGVIGVGAITETGEDTQYSNKADHPPKAGVRTFGGDITRTPPAQVTALDNPFNVTDATAGLLGIYPGEVPDLTIAREPSTLGPLKTKPGTGWVRWCGTSFATAVMTAMTAKALCKGMQLRHGSGDSQTGVLTALQIEKDDNSIDKDYIVTQGAS